MRVAVDARRLQDRPLGGVGRLLANILPRLAGEVDVVLLTDGRRPPALGAGDLAQHPLAPLGSSREALWLQVAAPAWLSRFPGVFHCPCYGLPYRQPRPMVVSIHDITFEDHPEWFPPARRMAFRAQARWAARTAARILTGSAHVADRIVERYGVDPARVLVAPPGVDPTFSPEVDGEALVGLLGPLGVTRPYLVALGGAPRRGLALAVAAWRMVRDRGVPVDLVVVGSETPPAERGLVPVGSLDDRTWASVLAGAAALVYPTAYEGFGLPALEAAASGTPVVCAGVGSLPEVLGPAAAWCEDLRSATVAATLAELLADRDRAAELRRAGLERAAQRGGWDRAAAVTLQAYREAGDG